MGLNEFYCSIVDDVIDNVKEAFLNEGFDEEILKSLREKWISRIQDGQQPKTVRSRPQTSLPSSPRNSSPQQSLQPQILQNQPRVIQLDGSSDSSDEDDPIEDDDEDDDDDLGASDEDDDKESGGSSLHDDDPLNSGDDLSNDDSSEIFETENVMVCQYERISRIRNKWKFSLKEGIMNIEGKDYVFHRAEGDAEW